MYEKFAELANIEKGRRCLLRREGDFEKQWNELVAENNDEPLTVDDISTVFEQLDKKWYLEGSLLEKMPEDFKEVLEFVEPKEDDSGLDEVTFPEFWKWFEDFVRKNDILRASAFVEAEKRQIHIEQTAKKAEEEAARRERAMQEAMSQRSLLEEQFETLSVDMYTNTEIGRIMNKGAVIDGVEEKEGGVSLQGEHIVLIRSMLEIWGCAVSESLVEDLWNDSALAAWQKWLQEQNFDKSRGVDSQALRRLNDKDAFEEYLQKAYPVTDALDDDDFAHQTVEVRGFLEDEVDICVDCVDEETGEELRLVVPDNQVDSLKGRLAEADKENPVLATADRVSHRIVALLKPLEQPKRSKS